MNLSAQEVACLLNDISSGRRNLVLKDGIFYFEAA